jgi:hypothetical protein
MLPLVCNDAVALLFTFDLSRKSTLNSLREWYRQARGLNKVKQFLIIYLILVHKLNSIKIERSSFISRNKIR